MRPFRIEGERRTFATLEAAAGRAAVDRCPYRYVPSFPARPGTTHMVIILEKGAIPREHCILTNGRSYLVVMSADANGRNAQ